MAKANKPISKGWNYQARVGITKPIFYVPLLSYAFQKYRNTGYIMNILFISDRGPFYWHRLTLIPL